MFNGLMKAVTFSYDDGITQDQRLIEIFDKYGLKSTFNINSGLLGAHFSLNCDNVTVAHCKPRPDEVKNIYQNHEVAVHTLTHPLLPELSDEEIIRQVEEDRKALSEIVGYNVEGMAYPCGGVNNDDRVAEIIKNNTGVRFSRTITSTYNFDLQDNLYRFNPTVYHREKDAMERLAEEFLRLEPTEPKIFYIWGHSYEFDINNEWAWFEDFCKEISGRKDIFYGTNSQVLLK